MQAVEEHLSEDASLVNEVLPGETFPVRTVARVILQVKETVKGGQPDR
jgi:hypothetical protein